MIEKNDLFEELMHEMRNYLAKASCDKDCLSINGCFWSIGLLKKNHDNLKVRGDFSSVASESVNFISKKRIECTEYNIPPESDDDYAKTKQIIEDSKSWKLPVKECVLKERRWVFFLNREIAFKATLSAVACKGAEYGTSSCGLRVVSVTSDTVPDALDLSQLRLLLTQELLIQILSKQGFSVLSESETKEDCVRLHLTLNPALRIPDSIVVAVGVVKNLHTSKKECEIDPEHYQRLREKDMQEASIHKYGPNAREDSWKSFISSLASSSMKLDFLQSKISHPVSLDMSEGVVPNREKSYKGPQFLLYNYARLVSVLRSFDKKVDEGVYPPLVSPEDVDYSLLSEEEEWELLFNYILPYPSLLSQAVNINSRKFETQILIQFLQRLCTCVSAYYSRYRILSEPRTHLLPLMYARIHLMSAIKQIMLNIFQLFNIVPVSQM